MIHHNATTFFHGVIYFQWNCRAVEKNSDYFLRAGNAELSQQWGCPSGGGKPPKTFSNWILTQEKSSRYFFLRSFGATACNSSAPAAMAFPGAITQRESNTTQSQCAGAVRGDRHCLLRKQALYNLLKTYDFDRAEILYIRSVRLLVYGGLYWVITIFFGTEITRLFQTWRGAFFQRLHLYLWGYLLETPREKGKTVILTVHWPATDGW